MERTISVKCWHEWSSFDTKTDALACCHLSCEVKAEFSIHIWYVYAKISLGYVDGPFQPHPAKTIEGLFGHEQLHVVNWKNFLLGLNGEVMCAATPEEMEAAIWAKLKAFALEETQHKHVPPAKGVHYPPLKGPGTMPAPDTDS